MNKSATIGHLLGKIIIALKSKSPRGLDFHESLYLRDTLLQIPGFTMKDWIDINKYNPEEFDKDYITLKFNILNNLMFNIYDRSYALSILHSYFNTLPNLLDDDYKLMKLVSSQIFGDTQGLDEKLEDYLEFTFNKLELHSA